MFPSPPPAYAARLVAAGQPKAEDPDSYFHLSRPLNASSAYT